MRFRVWAPRAERSVEVEIGGRHHPLAAGAGGWWSGEAAAAPGDDYAFRVDGEGPFPDPRSRFQPHGVHGASRLIEPAAFAWSDRHWNPPPLASGLVYELHLGTFTPEGTCRGAIARLDHLVDLGVTHVELLPVAAFPGHRGWGYDGVAPFAPHAAYGKPEDLAGLVDACHARGLAVLLDVVYNHLGPDGNYLGVFAPFFTDRYHTPWGEAVNLDGPGSDEVRRYFLDNALHWLEHYRFDGLRLDAVHALYDQSATHFLEELAVEVAALSQRLGRHLVLIAESDLNDPRLVRSGEAGGYGLDAAWSDDFHHALHAALTGERDGYYAGFGRLDDVARALREVYVYAGRHDPHRGRRHGRPVGDLPATRFLGYLQNHDQVGNRARGERLAHLVSPGRARVGAALLLTSPFVPLLFQGEEWAASAPFRYFTDHQDADLAAAVRDGRRQEFAAFGWQPAEVPDPQDQETFATSRLDWNERDRPPHRETLEWYRSLIRLRRQWPELVDGRRDLITVRSDDGAGWIAIERGRIAVAANLGSAVVRVPLSAPPRRLLLASEAGVRADGSAAMVAPAAVGIFEIDAAGRPR